MDNDKDLTESAKIKVNFRMPSRMPSLYAHHLVVQPAEEEVALSFFEVVLPIIPEQDSEERIRIIQEQGIFADCIARITIAKNRFPSFVEAMQQVLDSMKAGQSKEESTDADNSSDN